MSALPLTLVLSTALGVVLAGIALAPRDAGPNARSSRARLRLSLLDRGVVGPTPTTVAHAVRRFRRRRALPGDDDLADWCDELARRVRSGDSLATALTSVGSAGDPTAPAGWADPMRVLGTPMRRAIQRGVPVADAVVTLRGLSPGLDHAVGVIRTCALLGGAAGPALHRTASALRDRSAALAERRTHSAQARLSALVLTILPGAVLGIVLAVSPTSRTALAGPIGLISIPAGAAANGIGWIWMRSLLRSEP